MTKSDHFEKAIAFAWAIPFARWPILKIVLFLQYLVFFRAVFSTTQLKCSCRMVFRMFLAFLIFYPNIPFSKDYIAFAWAIAFARWPILKIVSFLNIWCFFECFFAENNSNVLVECFFMFLVLLILDTKRPFSKGYSLCMGSRLCKMAQYLVFFRAVFCTEKL